MPASIFADEWRECLRAHYMTVIRTDDRITERTLRGVMMHEAGFTEAELKELAVRATMRVEDTPADFVPDLAMMQGDAAPRSFAVAAPPDAEAAAAVEAPQVDALATPAESPIEAETVEAVGALLVDGVIEANASPESVSDVIEANASPDLLDDGIDGEDDPELMVDAMLQPDASAEMTTAELLVADLPDAELEDPEANDEEPDDAPPTAPPPEQLSLF